MTRPPLLSLLGLLVIAGGLLLDVVLIASASPAGHQHHAGTGLTEHSTHLVVTLGMALVLAGVVIDGARLHLRRRRLPAPSERSHSHAHR